MIIGIDASRAVKQNKTGVEWYAYHVINELIKLDKNNQYVLYCLPRRSSDTIGTKAGEPQPDEWLAHLAQHDNVTVKRLRWPFKYLWTQGRLSLEMFFHPPDILFVPASAMPVVHPKNTVAVVHDVGFMRFPKRYNKWQRRYLRWSTKFAVRHAKKIITISNFSQQEIIKYFTPSVSPPYQGGEKLADKVTVTYLGYDKNSFDAPTATNDILQKYNITKPYILYVGRLDEKKNITNTIKAFNLYNAKKTHQLVLAGAPGYGWDKAKKLIAHYNLQTDIVITGYVPDSDLPALYQHAALFLFPSRYEGFGLPVLEAMACSVPVVCSNTTSLPEITRDAAALVNHEDPADIAQGIARVLNDETLRRGLTYKGKERAGEFSWERCGEETLRVLVKSY